MPNPPLVTISLAAGAAALAASDRASCWCEYDRRLVAAGQVWRLATCHLAHWSISHAAWSGLCFAALSVICECRMRRQMLATICLSAACISAALLLTPSVMAYRGLSGIDSALFGMLAMRLIGRGADPSMRPIALAALLLFLAKITWEFHVGRALFVASEGIFRPFPMGHLVGLIVGMAVGARIENRRAGSALFLRRAHS